MPIARAATIVGCLAALTHSGAAFADCAPVDRREIQAELAAADRALERADYRRASDLAKAALAKIGDGYVDAGMIDDSGQKLSLADGQERRGDWKHAATLRIRLAHSRFDALARKSGC